MEKSKTITGWFGGRYENSGLFKNKECAETGLDSRRLLHELFSEYRGKKIKITIEITRE